MKLTCSLCSKTIEKIIISNVNALGGNYDIFYCDQCMVGRTNPVIPPGELASLYSNGNYRSESGKRFHWLVEKLIYFWRLQRKKRVEEFVVGGKILDIGCGRGLFLDIMRAHGWTVKGVEFGEEAAENASFAHGINVIGETRMRSELADEEFDVITINHVLEHVYNPLETIRECARILKTGGLLVVSVPNILSQQASFGKQDWFHLDIPYHLHHFSEQGLSKLLHSHSFVIRKARRFDWEYNIFGWLQTLLNRTWIQKNLLYDSLKTKRLKKNSLDDETGWGLMWTLVLLPFFVPLALILSFTESYIFNKGGTFEIYALKI